MRLVFSLIALGSLFASSLQAAPLYYKISMVADAQGAAHRLDGASLQLNLTWDASLLTPINSNDFETIWPNDNTVASMTVSGSTASDGKYAVSFVSSPTLTWAIDNDVQGVGDLFRFPVMRFEIDGETIESGVLFAHFASTFFSSPHPFFPKPFTFADATWDTVNFSSIAPNSGVIATVVDASVAEAPEPTALAMGGLGLVVLAALGRRK